jgi:hypothetical protein
MGSRGTPAKITVLAHPIATLNAAEDAAQKKTQPRPRSAHRQKTSNAFDVSDSSPTAQVTSFFCSIFLIAPVESQVTRALSMSSLVGKTQTTLSGTLSATSATNVP